MTTKNPSIGCAILTYNAQHHLKHVLPPLLHSPLNPRILVLDSSSHDQTIKTAQQYRVDTHKISNSEFNHGTTRNLARQLLKTDIIVMITQDAYLVDQHVLEKLITPIVSGQAVVTYARQIPHRGAKFFEAFPREFNYPSVNELRGIEDLPKHGTYTFFCSNSCAAYSDRHLEEIGGFPQVLFGEDTVVVAKMLRKGHKIAYVADALVHHSHKYTLVEEFRRNFDIGLARTSYAHLLSGGDSDSKRGWRYAKAMLERLAKESPYLLPYGCMHIFAKWIGYRIGQRCVSAPRLLKKALSSQPYYWDKD